METIRRFTIYCLITFTVIFAFIGLLATWDVISSENLVKKIIATLVIFCVSSIGLFFCSSALFGKDKEENEKFTKKLGRKI